MTLFPSILKLTDPALTAASIASDRSASGDGGVGLGMIVGVAVGSGEGVLVGGGVSVGVSVGWSVSVGAGVGSGWLQAAKRKSNKAASVKTDDNPGTPPKATSNFT